MKRLILASNSPRRRELLEQIGVEFEVIPSNAEEKVTKQEPSEVVEELSRQKAEDVASGCPVGTMVIGADTVVSVGNEILGKPGTPMRAYEMLEKMGEGILGGNTRRFINYIGTIFLFILFCNLSGLLGLRAPTADYGVTFLLGMFTFFIVNYQGIKNRGVRHFTSLFEPVPVLFPINLIGEIANPLSISLRLFANLLSGVIIMGLWYGMLPIFVNIGIPAALHVYCDLFSGCIQTYVFCMLTMVYINDKME